MAGRDQAIGTTIVPGFLECGKTTLINALLRSPDLSDAIVIVNELGEISIDHDLARGGSEKIVRLESGRPCCALRGDVVDILSNLALQRQAGALRRFSRVIIEATGLADPGHVIQVIRDDLVAPSS